MGYSAEGGEPKPIPHDQLKNYLYRIIVAGTRGYEDYVFFSEYIFKYLSEMGYKKEDVVFVSGAARTGADAMIIRWCKEHGYAWTEFHPDWDDVDVTPVKVKYRNGKPYNALAGFIRNEEMAEIATNLLTFYDGVSSGTSDMIDRMTERFNLVRVVLIAVKK